MIKEHLPFCSHGETVEHVGGEEEQSISGPKRSEVDGIGELHATRTAMLISYGIL